MIDSPGLQTLTRPGDIGEEVAELTSARHALSIAKSYAIMASGLVDGRNAKGWSSHVGNVLGVVADRPAFLGTMVNDVDKKK